jgi:hypothetical protein
MNRWSPSDMIVTLYLGMTAFFICLVANGSASNSPGWLVWSAFALMLGGVGLDIVQRIRRRNDFDPD